MNTPTSLSLEVLDEDLRIVRATLATIAGEVEQFSGEAGHAVIEALERLDYAQEEFSRLSRPDAV